MSERVDLCTLVCPMPVLKVKKLLAVAAPGAEVSVVTDDPHAVADIKLFCEQSGHTLLSQTQEDEKVVHCIKRRA